MTQDPPKIYVVGVGGDGLAGLTSRARDLVAGCDLLVGSDGALRLLPEVNAERVRIGSDLGEVTEKLRANFAKKRIVVVATGDPLFYGVARYLCDRLGKDQFEVLPHVSSMQLAFARVKESWEEAYLTNLAAGRSTTCSTGSAPPRRSACSPARRTTRPGSPASCSPAASTTSAPTSARTWAARTSGSPRASWPTFRR